MINDRSHATKLGPPYAWLSYLAVLALVLMLVPVAPSASAVEHVTSVSGTVTDAATGDPIADLCVTILEEGVATNLTPRETQTASDGTYTFEFTPEQAGFYNVWFGVCGDPDGYLSQFGFRPDGSQEDAVVEVVEGQVVTGIDAALDALESIDGADISGTITVPADYPDDTVCYRLPSPAENGAGRSVAELTLPADSDSVAFTAADMSFGNLGTEYYLEVFDCALDTYRALYKDDQTGTNSTLDPAEATLIPPGTSGIDITLIEGVAVNGSFRDATTDELVPDVEWYLDPTALSQVGNPNRDPIINSDGTFRGAALLGEHRLFATQVQPDPLSGSEPLRYRSISEVVQVDGSHGPFDFKLERGGFVNVTLDPELASFSLALEPLNGDFSQFESGFSQGDGAVQIGPALPGDYELSIGSYARRFELWAPATENVTVTTDDDGVPEDVALSVSLERGAGLRSPADLGRCGPVVSSSGFFFYSDLLHTGERLATGFAPGTYRVLCDDGTTTVEFEDVVLTAGEILDLGDGTYQPVDPGDPTDPEDPEPVEPATISTDPGALLLADLPATFTLSTTNLDLNDALLNIYAPFGDPVAWNGDISGDGTTTTITVPDDAAAGRYWIDAFDPNTGQWAFTSLEIRDPRLSLARSRFVEGQVGLEVTVSGFERPLEDEALTFTILDDANQEVGSGFTGVTADRLWGDVFLLDLGQLEPGRYRLVVEKGSDTAERTFVVDPAPDPAEEVPPLVEIDGAESDPETGEVTLRSVISEVQDVTVQRDLSGLTGCTPTGAEIRLAGEPFAMSDGDGDEVWEVVIPGADIQRLGGGNLELVVTCDEADPVEEPVGTIVLFDPSGDVTDATNDEPIVGATVSLHFVPGWTPEEGPEDVGQADRCQSNLTKPGPSGWDQEAPTDLGEVLEPSTPALFDPNDPVQSTDETGRYSWDVAAGCWYVTVEADGYETLTSPVVGVNEVVGEVTDLDLALTPTTTTPPITGGTPPITGGTPPADVPKWLTCDGVEGTTFSDVAAGATHADTIGCLGTLELIRGFTGGEFRPGETMSRQQFASVLDRALASAGIELEDAEAPFGDVSGTHAAAIGRLWAADIIKGVTADQFDPGGTVTRAQAIALLVRASDEFGRAFPASGTPFPDTVGTTHEDAIARAREAGITLGVDDERFVPGADVRRDQASSLFARWLTWNAGS